MNKPDTPSVLFVCVRNSGKSQMAAGLMRELVGTKVAGRYAVIPLLANEPVGITALGALTSTGGSHVDVTVST